MQIRVKTFDDLTPRELYAILKLRSEVFVVEQQCIYSDPDGKDLQAIHVWMEDETGVLGTLRILPAGLQGDTVAIGRVVTRDRNKGYGKILMQAGLEAAVHTMQTDVVRIEAQCYAQAFYEKLGFSAVSEPFMEDGIPHMHMEWRRGHAG